MRRVLILGEAAAVEVRGCNGDEIVVDGDHDRRDDGDVVVIEPRDTTTRATATNAQIVVQIGGGTEPLRVQMPATAVLDVRLTSGSVALTGLAGPIDVRLDVGAITAVGITPTSARLSCDVGSIVVRAADGTDAATADVRVRVGRADVR